MDRVNREIGSWSKIEDGERRRELEAHIREQRRHERASRRGSLKTPHGDAQRKEQSMPRGEKTKYTKKQKRQANHIEEGYEERGLPEEEAERRAWATVNRMTGGGKKSGSGRGKPINLSPAKKGGKKGGEASASRPAAARSASARKAARTRAQHAT